MIKEDMNHGFNPTNGTTLHRILLLVVGFRELVLDQILALDPPNLLTLIFFGIVSPKRTWSSIVSDEVLVASGEFTLPLEPKQVNAF